MPYPPAPWQMSGQSWLSLFRVRTGHGPDRPPGVYGVALLSYQQPSPLTYSELLVARPASGAGRGQVSITDIWVDSPDSRDGGRELWAIPKGLCDFARETRTAGPISRTSWSVYSTQGPLASARFTDVSRVAPRLPFRGGTLQHRDDGTPATAPLSGSAKSLPCVGRWRFDPDGPLGWLVGARQLGSARMADFSMSFG